jgi:hypothetical protein
MENLFQIESTENLFQDFPQNFSEFFFPRSSFVHVSVQLVNIVESGEPSSEKAGVL